MNRESWDRVVAEAGKVSARLASGEKATCRGYRRDRDPNGVVSVKVSPRGKCEFEPDRDAFAVELVTRPVGHNYEEFTAWHVEECGEDDVVLYLKAFEWSKK